MFVGAVMSYNRELIGVIDWCSLTPNPKYGPEYTGRILAVRTKNYHMMDDFIARHRDMYKRLSLDPDGYAVTSLLEIAIPLDYTDVVRYLLQQQAEHVTVNCMMERPTNTPNITSRYITELDPMITDIPMVNAAKSVAMLDLLLAEGSFDPAFTDKVGRTPLHHIVSEPIAEASLEMAKRLVQAGVSPSVRDKRGRLAWDICQSKSEWQALLAPNNND